MNKLLDFFGLNKKKVKEERDFSYGILKYSSVNIGDEIQSIAAMRFLPKIEEYIHREQLNKYFPKTDKKTKLIMNAWWLHKPQNFPPTDFIDPLLISMHISVKKREKLLTEEVRKYFLEHGPVGCRDISTYEWLKSEGIPAYFSGCLTLTLQRNKSIKRENYILCIDIPEEVVDEIKKRTKRPVYSLSSLLTSYYNSKQRLKVAKIFLRLLHNAHCVVSTRLHVILPCLAFETPVLRINIDENGSNIAGRFSGFEDFMHTVTVEEFISNKKCYNFNFPPKNPNKHLKMKKDLIERCKNFTGYDRKKSLMLHYCNPLAEMFQLQQYNYDNIKRILYWGRIRDLKKVLANKENDIAKHDLKYIQYFKSCFAI